MKKIKVFILTLMTLVLFTNCNSQVSNDLENYYTNTEVFKTDTIYNDVLIDGRKFTIKVLSDKLNEHLEPYEKTEIEDEDLSPKTIVFYDIDSSKIAYVKKFDISTKFHTDYSSLKPSFEKLNGDIRKEGRLYLNLFNSNSPAPTYKNNIYHVYIEKGKIQLSKIFESYELSSIYFNKNDKEILVFESIWNSDDGGRFSDHKYKITSYKYSYYGFETDEYGTTFNKYPSESFEIGTVLPLMKTYEKFLPNGISASDYIQYTVFD